MIKNICLSIYIKKLKNRYLHNFNMILSRIKKSIEVSVYKTSSCFSNYQICLLLFGFSENINLLLVM